MRETIYEEAVLSQFHGENPIHLIPNPFLLWTGGSSITTINAKRHLSSAYTSLSFLVVSPVEI